MEKVALLKADSYEKNLKEKLLKLVDLLGGFEVFVKKGDRVLIKPNFVMANPLNSATTTDPAFIAAISEILLDFGCRVAIGDSPMVGNCKSVARGIGLYERLAEYNIEFVNFNKSVPVDLKNNPLKTRKFKNLTIAGELERFDKIINLPKLKSHAQMGVTLATKNLFGCVVGARKTLWHVRAGSIDDFARLMIEIAQTVKPVLNIMDGIIGMDRNGPNNGRKRETGVILASTNCLALDRVVIELIQKKPEKIAFTRVAKKLGLSGAGLNEIEVLGDSIKNCKVSNFELLYVFPVDFVGFHWLYGPLKKLLSQRIKIDQNKCIFCGKCEEICPMKAISLDKKNKKMIVDRSICIKCCCCQESCPAGAIVLHTPRIMKHFLE